MSNLAQRERDYNTGMIEGARRIIIANRDAAIQSMEVLKVMADEMGVEFKGDTWDEDYTIHLEDDENG